MTHRLARPGPFSSVRSQAAFVRALLDEVERVTPSASDDVVTERIVEEPDVIEASIRGADGKSIAVRSSS